MNSYFKIMYKLFLLINVENINSYDDKRLQMD